jgi:hypothetical protein
VRLPPSVRWSTRADGIRSRRWRGDGGRPLGYSEVGGSSPRELYSHPSRDPGPGWARSPDARAPHSRRRCWP